MEQTGTPGTTTVKGTSAHVRFAFFSTRSIPLKGNSMLASYRCSAFRRGWVCRLPSLSTRVTNRQSFDRRTSVPSPKST